MNIQDIYLNKIITGFSDINEVQAITIGGSHATGKADDKSDYDVYIYTQNKIDKEIRQNILSSNCSYMEIENTYWELEDNCTILNGIYIDIIYRNINDFEKAVVGVVENCVSRNGYTTCLWHNLLTSEIVFDRNNVLENMKKRFSIPYPEKLKNNIINHNMNLLTDKIVSYDKQIKKSVIRKDIINLNNRIAVFLDSYFDIIFALNKVKNPGEKRIIEICLEQCKILPNNFEDNLKSLLSYMFNDIEKINDIIDLLIYELKEIIKST